MDKKKIFRKSDWQIIRLGLEILKRKDKKEKDLYKNEIKICIVALEILKEKLYEYLLEFQSSNKSNKDFDWKVRKICRIIKIIEIGLINNEDEKYNESHRKYVDFLYPCVIINDKDFYRLEKKYNEIASLIKESKESKEVKKIEENIEIVVEIEVNFAK